MTHRNTETGSAIRGANKPSLPEVFSRVIEEDAALDETFVAAGDLEAKAMSVCVNGRELSLGGQAIGRFARHFGMPGAYAASLRPQLRADIWNSHLRHGEFADPKMAQGPIRVLSRGDALLGMDRADLAVLNGQTVLQAVIEGIGADGASLHVERFELINSSLLLDVVSPRVETAVRPGDILCGGLRIEHSLLGETATKIEPFMSRLICSNGAIVRECVGARQGGRTRRLSGHDAKAREQQVEQVKRLARQGFSVVAKKLSAVRDLTAKPLKNEDAVTNALGEFLRRARMHSAGLMTLLQRAWHHPMGGARELTYFGLLNALTWLATHRNEPGDSALTDRQANILLRLAGVFANQTVHICPSCFSVVAA